MTFRSIIKHWAYKEKYFRTKSFSKKTTFLRKLSAVFSIDSATSKIALFIYFKYFPFKFNLKKKKKKHFRKFYIILYLSNSLMINIVSNLFFYTDIDTPKRYLKLTYEPKKNKFAHDRERKENVQSLNVMHERI